MAYLISMIFYLYVWFGLATAIVVPVRVTTVTSTLTSTVTTTATSTFTSTVTTSTTTTTFTSTTATTSTSTTSTTSTTTTILLCNTCVCPKERKNGCNRNEIRTLPYGQTACGTGFIPTNESVPCSIVLKQSKTIYESIGIIFGLMALFLCVVLIYRKKRCINNS
jgi:hypothetical protein